MDRSKFFKKPGLIITVSLVLFFQIGMKAVHGQNNADIVTAIEPVNLNIFYLGIDNPVKIAASGFKTSELQVSTDNGLIHERNGNYIFNPVRLGKATVTVMARGKVIQKKEFRVKMVRDPFAAVMTTRVVQGFKTGGNISKDELLQAGGIRTIIFDFYFDVEFKVVSFILYTTTSDLSGAHEVPSNLDKFSKAQIDIIKSLKKNQRLVIDDIMVTGPDGVNREINGMIFTISDE
ncbi:MAG TPA: GldM family protein [Bacteroidales bacterium]